MLIVNDHIKLKNKELRCRPIKSSGPGGQNVNKNSTAIILIFDILNSTSLPVKLKNRLLEKPHKYLTKSGKVIIKVNRYKSQKKK